MTNSRSRCSWRPASASSHRSLASAQTLAGTVRDTSGAVLPGVTVEASSPALIEKTRTAVTDGSGQYQITNLPPGTYAITFSLQGFSTLVREGVELTGGGVTTINAELRVGAVAESVTVTGETPVVDVQSARQQTVLSGDVVRALPASRGYGNYLAAIPGHPGDRLQHRRRDEHQLLHRPRRPRQRGRRPDRRHERRLAVQRRRRVQLRLRHEQRDRSPGVDLRRPGRGRPGRAVVQHHPQDGRQHLQRERLRELGRASGASRPTSTTSCARWDSPTRRPS